MSDVDVLESVLRKDEALLAAVRPDQAHEPTDCPEYDTAALVEHLVEWMSSFADGAGASPPPTEDGDAAARFRTHADRCLAAWREQGTERTVHFMSSDLPGDAALSMTLMEFVTHGLDLARATGQPEPFTDDELELVLERAAVTLPDQYRGEGKPFGAQVEVPDDATPAARLRGFMGRTP